jgi:hypothetical protein
MARATLVRLSAGGVARLLAVVKQRRFLSCLTALAVLCAVLQGLTGLSELALFMTPLFVIGALLLSGRYVGADRIAARWRATVGLPGRKRRRAGRWRARAVLPLRSLHEQGSFGVRGPPALSAPAA